jgi:hypothetical protein
MYKIIGLFILFIRHLKFKYNYNNNNNNNKCDSTPVSLMMVKKYLTKHHAMETYWGVEV